MRKIITVLIVAFIAIASFGFATVAMPVFADDECGDGVPTAILGENGCYKDDGNGSGVIKILSDVVNIMTIGIGILGVLGITIVGVQYLTAGDNEEKTRKAKRRMFEIVIGLVAYVVVYALLNWLIPDFKPLGS